MLSNLCRTLNAAHLLRTQDVRSLYIVVYVDFRRQCLEMEDKSLADDLNLLPTLALAGQNYLVNK